MLKKEIQDIHVEIIDSCLKGNSLAQYRLYSMYSKAMFNICMRFLVHQQDAEDALQDAFAEVFDKLKTFRYESTPGAWIKRIVVNTCINKLKRKSPKILLTENPLDHQMHEETDLEDIQLKVKQIHEAIKRLPEGYRLIFCLYMFEGYDHNEISEIMGISESTSKTQYMKARRKLKELILLENERQT